MATGIHQLSFEQPQWFALLLLVPGLLYLHVKYLRLRTPGMFINELTPQISWGVRWSPVDYLLLIRITAITLVIVALTNPRYVYRISNQSPASETDIVLALDISKSMLIEDIKPNRLEALKDVLNRFVTMRSHDPTGIVLYAGESMNWCPLTKDQQLLLSRINKMEESNLNDGTAIGSGLASAINVLKQSSIKSRVIILLTDGENNAGIIDPVLAAGFARRFNIKIYTVGIGSTGYAQMPLVGFDGKKYYKNIWVTLNEPVLKKIATTTGGMYFKATDAEALKNIYAGISKIETKKTRQVIVVRYNSCQTWVAGAALCLLFLEAILRFTVLRIWPA